MVIAQQGIVATSQTIASQAGAQILAHGGSAADAAIAANAVLGVVEPMMNGIGGDLFVIYREGVRHNEANKTSEEYYQEADYADLRPDSPILLQLVGPINAQEVDTLRAREHGVVMIVLREATTPYKSALELAKAVNEGKIHGA